MSEIIVEHNEEEERPIPHVWRPTFKMIVKAFSKKDYHFNKPIMNVNPISEDTAIQIKEYIEDYGEELTDLPEASWDTSRYIYYGTYWNVQIDLFTKNEGLSDLVLTAEVRKINNEYMIDIRLVNVP